MKSVRATSAETAVQALINASMSPLTCPAHVRLRKEDLPFWGAVIRSRARDEWTEADLIIAGQLARCMRDIEVESLALEKEGSTYKNEKGRIVANPRFTVLQQLTQRETALARALRMCGVPAGDPRSEFGQRAAQRHAETLREELRDDELLAR